MEKRSSESWVYLRFILIKPINNCDFSIYDYQYEIRKTADGELIEKKLINDGLTVLFYVSQPIGNFLVYYS